MRLRGEERLGDLSPDQISTKLLNRRATLQTFRNHRRELREEVRRYETKYEIDSSEIDEALSDGRLLENSEICSWIISYRLLNDMDAD